MGLEPTTPCLQISPRRTAGDACERKWLVRSGAWNVGGRLGMVHEMVYLRPGDSRQSKQQVTAVGYDP